MSQAERKGSTSTGSTSTRNEQNAGGNDSILDLPCLKCEEIIYGECLECDTCGNWCHGKKSCSGLTKPLLALVGDRHIKWVCDACLEAEKSEKKSV